MGSLEPGMDVCSMRVLRMGRCGAGCGGGGGREGEVDCLVAEVRAGAGGEATKVGWGGWSRGGCLFGRRFV